MGMLRELMGSKLMATPAPRVQKSRQRDRIEQFAPLILEACYHGVDMPFRLLAEAAGFSRTNIVATVLGVGVAGRGGARLWMRNGLVLACQENCALLAPFLTAAAEEEMLARIGIDRDAFMTHLQQLPQLSGVESPDGDEVDGDEDGHEHHDQDEHDEGDQLFTELVRDGYADFGSQGAE
jgi:hypothetical protein